MIRAILAAVVLQSPSLLCFLEVSGSEPPLHRALLERNVAVYLADKEDIHFQWKKSNDWSHLKEGNVDPENIERLFREYKAGGINVAVDSLRFDVYEDTLRGFSIAIPKGAQLKEEGDDQLSVDFGNFPDGAYMALSYGTLLHSGDPLAAVTNKVRWAWKDDVNGFTPTEQFTQTHVIDDEWSLKYYLLNGDSVFVNDAGEDVAVLFYMTIIYNQEKVFYSIASCQIPKERLDLNEAVDAGVDCTYFREQNVGACDYFELVMEVLAASHLTTRSSVE